MVEYSRDAPTAGAARASGLMNIGEAAQAADVSSKRIRHYEKRGLISPAIRSDSNYRLYSQADVRTLRFINSARAMGFPIAKISQLLDLWQNQQRSSADVKKMAMQHVEELEQHIGEVQSMVDKLRELAVHCHGDSRPECPILNGLAD